MDEITPWRLLFVDDEVDIGAQVIEFLKSEDVDGTGIRPQVEVLTNFEQALETLQSHRYDLLILDVRRGPEDPHLGDEAGEVALRDIQARRFIPVIFYTNLPHLVRHLQTPLIRVVEKTAGFQSLLDSIRAIFATRLPAVNLALIRHFESVQRDYMWQFVATNWATFGETNDRTGLAYLLARRLATSLSGPAIEKLCRDLGDSSGESSGEGHVHPMRCYVLPWVHPSPLTGDLYYGDIQGEQSHWILMTPSCDLVTGREKAEWVLFARCRPLTEEPEYIGWRAKLPSPSKGLEKELRLLGGNNRSQGQSDRFHFLPGTLTLPDLVVDFQQLTRVRWDELTGLDRLASLDSPFAESVLARFTRYLGRLGTPDLNLDLVLARLRMATGSDGSS